MQADKRGLFYFLHAQLPETGFNRTVTIKGNSGNSSLKNDEFFYSVVTVNSSFSWSATS
jgi:hypothetical protein